MLLYRAYGFILSCNKSGSNGLKYYKYYSYIKQPPTCLDGFCLMSHSSTLDYDTWVNKSQNKATISIMTCLESNAELLWRVILLLQGLLSRLHRNELVLNCKPGRKMSNKRPAFHRQYWTHTGVCRSQISLAFGSLIRSCFAAHRIRGHGWTRARHQRWSS